jgi:predicted glutamine amidotransferase
MCELFAMSSRNPTVVDFTLERLAERSGLEGPNKDGWGLAYYDHGDVLLLREPTPASQSELVRFMEQKGPPSRFVISHIRHATQGGIALRNTQPFQRELGGHVHVFAHNGTLKDIETRCSIRDYRYHRIGETDSEYAFCCLLQRMASLWDQANGGIPDPDRRLAVVAEFAAWLRPMGPANFLYSDGDTLFAHAHRRTQKNGRIMPPGLHVLRRQCNERPPDLSASGIGLPPMPQEITLLASVPLTGEPWEPLGEGEVVALRDGEIISRSKPELAGNAEAGLP